MADDAGPNIGVLALQGAVQPHKPHIEAAGGHFRAVKKPEHFEELDGVILPGGESTTMLRLIDNFNLWEPLSRLFKKVPVWGICAGAILMARDSYVTSNLSAREQEKEDKKAQKSFDLLPMTVRRNGYGTQMQSRHADLGGYTVSLIRAPVITDLKDPKIQIHASWQGDPVWISSGPYMATTFHPELTFETPSPMHAAFMDLVKSARTKA